MSKLLDLFRGFRGHPLHPPLTGISVGAYTVGVVALVVGYFGFEADVMANVGYYGLIIGLVASAATVLTGFIDYFRIPRGTAMRRTANFHWMIMAVANVSFASTVFVLRASYLPGAIPLNALITALVGFGLLTLGSWIGGAIVFVYGMRVLNRPDMPTTEAIIPHWPPD